MAYLGREAAKAPIVTADIPDNSITAAKIVDATIAAGDLAANSVDSSELVDGSIDTSHIGDNQVTLAKMAGGTDGNLITYDTSGDPAYVATGTSGHVLTSAGADAVPTFQAAASISYSTGTHTTSAGQSLSITSGYDIIYWTKIGDVLFGAGQIRFSSSGDSGTFFSLTIPETSVSTTGRRYSGSLFYYDQSAGTLAQLLWYINNGGTVMYIPKSASTLANLDELHVSITYHV